MKELESYCGTIDDAIYAYVEDYHTCSGIFSLPVMPAWIILLGDPLSASKCQHGQYRTLKVEYYPCRHLRKGLHFRHQKLSKRCI